jgi:hypothetical protein
MYLGPCGTRQKLKKVPPYSIFRLAREQHPSSTQRIHGSTASQLTLLLIKEIPQPFEESVFV